MDVMRKPPRHHSSKNRPVQKPRKVINLPLLEFKKLSYRTQDREILRDISLDVEAGDFISIVGPSGSGKSTLLKLASHLISPSSGAMLFKGKNYLDYPPGDLRKNIGYCFQTPHLFTGTVLDNLAFPYDIRHKKPDLARIHALLDLFHMSRGYLSREVHALSGGEKQRIALVRTMVCMPEVLLLDEVTSALDRDNAALVEKAMVDLNAQGTTILSVTHKIHQGKHYANKLLTLDQGKLVSFQEVLQ